MMRTSEERGKGEGYVCFVEPALPKYSFILADALCPLSSFFFLICSSWIEPRVDELHL
jgi:hypothetical protein